MSILGGVMQEDLQDYQSSTRALLIGDTEYLATRKQYYPEGYVMRMISQKVDKDGVLTLVQHMDYLYSDMTIRVWFFDGCIATFYAEVLVPDLALSQQRLTRSDRYQAEQFLEEHLEVYWNKIHNRDKPTK